MKQSFIIFLALSLSVVAASRTLYAQGATPTPTPTATPTPTPTPVPAALDFEGDGVSNIWLIEKQNDNSPNTYVNHIQLQDLSTKRIEFGRHQDGDQLIYGDYDGDGITDIALVSLDSDNNLEWKVRQSSDSETVTETWGNSADKVISGCDFAGDGKHDQAIIRGSSLFFKNLGDQSPTEVKIGVTKLKIYSCGDINGDGADELIAVRKRGRRRRKRAFYYAWDNKGALVVNAKKVRGRGQKKLIVADADNDGSEEFGYIRRKGTSGLAVFISDNTPLQYELSSVDLLGDGQYSVISMPESRAAGILFRARDGSIYRRALSSEATEELIDTSDFNSKTSLEIIHDVSFYSFGGSGSGSNSCDVNHDNTDGNEGFLWKPVSETTGEPVTLLPASMNPSSCNVERPGGSVFTTLRTTGRSNGNRTTWRPNKHGRCGSYPQSSVLACMQGGKKHCWNIPKPCTRYD